MASGMTIWVLLLLIFPPIDRFWGRRRATLLLLLDLPLTERSWWRSKVASVLLLLDVALRLRPLYTSDKIDDDNNKARRTPVLADQLRPASAFLGSILYCDFCDDNQASGSFSSTV
jgi:hypothetical protein